jgi:hypothetical protein
MIAKIIIVQIMQHTPGRKVEGGKMRRSKKHGNN